MFATDDVRIDRLRPLLPPAILMEELPLDEDQARQIATARSEVGDVLTGKDDRMVIVVGPCSVHDTKAALDYAARLKQAADRYRGELVVVMRTYFEKPRTTVGWKGLINDPDLDGSFAINRGLRVARGFLRDVVALGLPTATEFLDPITPQFVADLVAWGAIGARTTESQVHRELASGLSMPVGFKNGTSGAVQIAVDAVRSAASPHHFLSVTKQGLAAIVSTRGNPLCHVILRGGSNGPNYSDTHIAEAVSALEKAGLRGSVMVDCSHANSGKDPRRQPEVFADVAKRVAAGERRIFGLMLESFLVEGRQDPKPDETLVYGQSITDGCLSWDGTEPLLSMMSEAVRARRGRT
ncbi:MAG TPA: 3-deoxy-7-phosphoheptulonate synthase [Polyangiaceae bacterium]|nr:3-deoxy-7-phosphoheptulonate synthase [Polyangiaceae bacterium]